MNRGQVALCQVKTELPCLNSQQIVIPNSSTLNVVSENWIWRLEVSLRKPINCFPFILDMCLRKTWAGQRNHIIILTTALLKSSVLKTYKPAFSKSTDRFEERFRKVPFFFDGSVRTVHPTVKIKLRKSQFTAVKKTKRISLLVLNQYDFYW